MTIEQLEAAVDDAIAQCEGNARAAVRVLVLANTYLEAEVERLAEAVSRGFARGRVRSPDVSHEASPPRAGSSR